MASLLSHPTGKLPTGRAEALAGLHNSPDRSRGEVLLGGEDIHSFSYSLDYRGFVAREMHLFPLGVKRLIFWCYPGGYTQKSPWRLTLVR